MATLKTFTQPNEKNILINMDHVLTAEPKGLDEIRLTFTNGKDLIVKGEFDNLALQFDEEASLIIENEDE